MTSKPPEKTPPPGETAPERSSSLGPGPRAFVEALARAGIKLRVSQVQPDGMTPIYIAAPVAAVLRFVPPDGFVEGSAVRFPEDWVIAFCGSEHA